MNNALEKIDYTEEFKGDTQELTDICFEQIVYEWLGYKRIMIKESTLSSYRYYINKYLFPYMQNMSVEEMIKYDYNKIILELSQKLSAKTVKDISCILKSVLKYIENEYECKTKMDKINLPKNIRNNVVIFSEKEKAKLERYCLKENSVKAIGIIICLNTGLRIGEVCALKWEDIDMDKKIIYIRHTLERVYDFEKNVTKLILDIPKTQNSIREIPISNKLYEILKKVKKRHKGKDFFLSETNNKAIEPRNYEYYYKRILKKCKIRPYKFHTIRHTFATECIKVGMDIKTLSEILGHSNVDITLNIYVHSSYEIKKKYLEKL